MLHFILISYILSGAFTCVCTVVLFASCFIESLISGVSFAIKALVALYIFSVHVRIMVHDQQERYVVVFTLMRRSRHMERLDDSSAA